MELPMVAIGGSMRAIAASRSVPANFLGVVGAVLGHSNGLAAGVRAMNAAIEGA